jgi:hypothetical protein
VFVTVVDGVAEVFAGWLVAGVAGLLAGVLAAGEHDAAFAKSISVAASRIANLVKFNISIPPIN